MINKPLQLVPAFSSQATGRLRVEPRLVDQSITESITSQGLARVQYAILQTQPVRPNVSYCEDYVKGAGPLRLCFAQWRLVDVLHLTCVFHGPTNLMTHHLSRFSKDNYCATSQSKNIPTKRRCKRSCSRRASQFSYRWVGFQRLNFDIRPTNLHVILQEK